MLLDTCYGPQPPDLTVSGQNNEGVSLFKTSWRKSTGIHVTMNMGACPNLTASSQTSSSKQAV